MPPQPEIYYVLNGRWPTVKAYGVQVAKMCEAFARICTSVTLLVPDRRQHPQVDRDAAAFYGLRRAFPVVRLWSPDWLATGALGRLLFVAQQFAFALRARAYLWRHHGAVYTRDFITAFVFALTRRTYVLELHDAPRKWSALHRYCLRSAIHVVVITSILATRVREVGIDASHISVFADGFDPSEFENVPDMNEARRLLQLPFSGHIALYAGHLYAWKGVDVLAQAARLLDCTVVIVGGTTADVKRMRLLCRDIPNVSIVGHRPHSEMPLWFRTADVLVLPNSASVPISNNYTSPLKMFEYMASGVPIVASDLPSLRDVLSQENAFLVMPDDAQSLARAIRTAFDAPDRAQRASRASADVIRFSWDNRAHGIIDNIIQR